MDKNLKIRVLATIVLIGFLVTIAFHYINDLYRVQLPVTLGGAAASSLFCDFNPLYSVASGLDPYFTASIAGNYFPFAYLIAYPFTFFPHALSIFLFLSIYIIGLGCLNKHFLSLSGAYDSLKLRIENFSILFILTFMTYPFLFALNRGNAEIFVFLFLALGLFFYEKKHYTRSIIFLACATAMKAYPGIFLLLLLSDKRYKEALQFVGLVCLLTGVSLLIYHSPVLHQIQNFLMSVNLVKQGSVASSNVFASNLGIYGELTMLSHLYHHISLLSSGLTPDKTLLHYSFFAFLTGCGAAFYLVFVEKIFWRKVALCIFLLLLLPPISYDYKLLHIYIVIYFFSNYVSPVKNYKEDLFITISLGLLLILKNYYLFDKAVNISSLLNVLILLLLSSYLVINGVRSYFQNRAIKYKV